MNTLIKNIVKSLGLSEQEARVYESLFGQASLGIYEISRLSKVNRTSTYRILTNLEKRGFVHKSPKVKKIEYTASNLEWLELKLKEKKEISESILESFKANRSLLQKRSNPYGERINVVHYSGKKEVQQLLWNSLKANKILRAFGFRSSREAIGLSFLVKWWNEMVFRGFEYRMIANPGTYKMKYETEKLTKKKFYKPNFWILRSIKDSTLPIRHETLIFNDTYSIIQWKDEQIFGVEIINQTIADQQKILFDYFWKAAKPFRNQPVGR
ncbi:MAG: helix-turn-helix domain-containing protein [Candidatus Dojkabacteria bacterium]|nr:helix-turn-helix domain-containing protein [Candidatus Dojkabacteria bacterium]